ncbi:hypothetical protein BCR43DRAFT_490693 [Syncephalastrum racemosum]|uniref:SMP domain-containing protein n=1 Tax=Syncephalastrum racemosum TaxID=13706 RepID=A0A1X2HGE0_SYNRA|nr:hypothetical protein BCR43DRAFT_490693 [Syncephalastrum racemosum]
MKLTFACVTLGASIAIFSGASANQDTVQVANDITSVRSLVANTFGQSGAPKHDAAPADEHAKAIQEKIAQIQKQNDEDMRKAEAEGRVIHYTEYTPSSSLLGQSDEQGQKRKRDTLLANALLKGKAKMQSKAQMKKEEASNALVNKLIQVDSSPEKSKDEAQPTKNNQVIGQLAHKKVAHIDDELSKTKPDPHSFVEVKPNQHDIVGVNPAGVVSGQAFNNAQ